jgi:hypothetical protein
MNYTISKEQIEQAIHAIKKDVPLPYYEGAISMLQGLLPQQEGEPLTSTYVQTVPDKCDRIVWRNHYYHLPINPAPVAQPDGEPTEYQWKSKFTADKWERLSKKECELVESTDAYTQEPRTAHTRRLFTHPATSH